MGYFFIALSVCSSLIIAHFLKLSERSESRVLNVLSINYLAAACIGFSISEYETPLFSGDSLPVIIIALLLGIIFIVNLFVYSSSIDKIGMGISITAMRISLVIPIFVSLFIYNEHLSYLGYAGMGLVLISLYLLIPRAKEKESLGFNTALYPLLIFLFSGFIDVMLKVFEREYNHIISEYTFLGFIFLSAFISGILMLLRKKELSFKPKEIFYGIIIGIANLYSSFFLLLALKEMSGSMVFSLTNISIVLIGTIIGVLVWKDRLTVKQKMGLFGASLSILLLIG